MTYSVYNTASSANYIVSDGTLNTDLDISLVGKGYIGYGQAVNRNFVQLLENFSSPSAPTKPIQGQLWYDSLNGILNIFDGISFVNVVPSFTDIVCNSLTAHSIFGNTGTINTFGATTANLNRVNSGDMYVTGNIIPTVDNIYDIGTVSLRWKTVYGVTFAGTSTTARYADLAELYEADADYAPGTVVEFNGEFEITEAHIGSKRIAGVISTNPAYLMNSHAEGKFMLPVALTGRVPCKVIGPVTKGDMLVSAGDGYAVVSEDPKIGSVIGKALENMAGGSGIIEVVVGRF